MQQLTYKATSSSTKDAQSAPYNHHVTITTPKSKLYPTPIECLSLKTLRSISVQRRDRVCNKQYLTIRTKVRATLIITPSLMRISIKCLWWCSMTHRYLNWRVLTVSDKCLSQEAIRRSIVIGTWEMEVYQAFLDHFCNKMDLTSWLGHQ